MKKYSSHLTLFLLKGFETFYMRLHGLFQNLKCFKTLLMEGSERGLLFYWIEVTKGVQKFSDLNYKFRRASAL